MYISVTMETCTYMYIHSLVNNDIALIVCVTCTYLLLWKRVHTCTYMYIHSLVNNDIALIVCVTCTYYGNIYIHMHMKLSTHWGQPHTYYIVHSLISCIFTQVNLLNSLIILVMMKRRSLHVLLLVPVVRLLYWEVLTGVVYTYMYIVYIHDTLYNVHVQCIDVFVPTNIQCTYMCGVYVYYIHAYIQVIHTYVYTYIHIYIHTYIITYIHTSMHTYICVCIYIYTYMTTCTYILTYIHKYIQTYIHAYIHT